MKKYQILYKHHAGFDPWSVVTTIPVFTARTQREANAKMQRKVKGLRMTSIGFIAQETP